MGTSPKPLRDDRSGVADCGLAHRPDVFHTRSEQHPLRRSRSKASLAGFLAWASAGPCGHPHWFDTSTIEQHQTFFGYLGVVGALYIASIGVSVMRSSSLKTEDVDERLGFMASCFKVVNGKAWIHFLVLTTFGQVFGTGALAKVLLVLLNLSFGWPAVLTWAAFGSYLRSLFIGAIVEPNLRRVGVAVYLVLA